jgi:4-amino-4-deoxychorismate mutase
MADALHNSRQSGTDGDELARLRAELDATDYRLLDALRARMDCCRKIAEYKREHGVPMMQPQRIGVVQGRAARYGEANNLDPGFLQRLYEIIISETCRIEDLIIEGQRG